MKQVNGILLREKEEEKEKYQKCRGQSTKPLHLTLIKLIKRGFKCNIIENDIIMRIKTVNGCFYYNPLNVNYVWSYKTIIDTVENKVNLSITTEEELETVLKVFGCDYSKWL